ncbi:hypothetical protein BKI52_39775 [marine bacterium AO1-C]|nr:hypothetical protein BKI52_39775 [marine bacterium AO1-C]
MQKLTNLSHTQGEQLWQDFLEHFQPDTPLSPDFEEAFWIDYQQMIFQSATQRVAQATPPKTMFNEDDFLMPYDHQEGLKTIYHKFWPFPHTAHILQNEEVFIRRGKSKKQQQNFIVFGWFVNISLFFFGQGGAFFLGMCVLLFWQIMLNNRKKIPRTEEYFWFKPLYIIHKKIEKDEVIQENHIYYKDIYSLQKRGKDLRIYSRSRAQEIETFIPQKVETIDKIEQFFNQIVRFNQRRLNA